MAGTERYVRNSTADFLVFTKDSETDGIEVRVQDHEVWLTQKGIGQLFDVDRSVVAKHLRNIFAENELSESTTCAKFAQVASLPTAYHVLLRFATRIRLAALFVFAKSSFQAFFLINRESAKTSPRLVLSKSSFHRIYGVNREFSLMAAKSLCSISRNSIFSKAYRDASSSTTEQHPATYEKILDFT